MPAEKRLRGFWMRWGFIFVIATVVGLFFSSQYYLSYLYSDYEPSWKACLTLAMPNWYVWAFLAPAIMWLSTRFPFERRRWRSSLWLHIGTGFVFAAAKVALLYAVTHTVSWLPERSASLAHIHTGLLTYWAIVGISNGVQYYRKYRERELQASRLETKLAEARLQVLEMQLQPHFLFNTLHAISSLMHRDVQGADRMMTRLSDLLRLTLDNGHAQEVSLKKELEFLDGYLEIEQIRFQDRLTIRKEIDPAVLDARVPNLILQPLVENAIRHGIEPRSEPGLVEIRCYRSNETLWIQIRDDGPGLSTGSENKEGIGLANTRERLKQRYPDSFRFELEAPGGRGLRVSLAIPYRAEDHG